MYVHMHAFVSSFSQFLGVFFYSVGFIIYLFHVFLAPPSGLILDLWHFLNLLLIMCDNYKLKMHGLLHDAAFHVYEAFG